MTTKATYVIPPAYFRYFGPVLQQLVSSLLLIQPSSRLTASQVLNLPEISTIVKKLQSKHSDIYTTSRSRSPGSNYRESRGHRLRSRSPGVDKLPKEVHAGDRDSTEIKRNRLSNRVAPLKDRNRQDLIKSSHQGRSLTPDLRRVRRGERQNSEPRRHSYSNNEKENAPYENVRGSVLKSSNDKNRTEKNDFNLKEGNKRLTPCISKVKAGDTKQHVVGSEASGAGPVNTRENNDKNNSSKVS